MKGTMCGLVKETSAPGKFVYRTDLPIPQINDDEVLIKIHCTAVCGTDLHIMEWDQWSQARVKTPLIPGHETAGDIVEVGKNVRDRKVGDRVSCETHIPCGTCWFCKNGLPHICKNVRLFGATENGAFAEYAKIPAKNTFLLDDDIAYRRGSARGGSGWLRVHPDRRLRLAGGTGRIPGREVSGSGSLCGCHQGCGPRRERCLSSARSFTEVRIPRRSSVLEESFKTLLSQN